MDSEEVIGSKEATITQGDALGMVIELSKRARQLHPAAADAQALGGELVRDALGLGREHDGHVEGLELAGQLLQVRAPIFAAPSDQRRLPVPLPQPASERGARNKIRF
jgi:hypothetical protein